MTQHSFACMYLALSAKSGSVGSNIDVTSSTSLYQVAVAGCWISTLVAPSSCSKREYALSLSGLPSARVTETGSPAPLPDSPWPPGQTLVPACHVSHTSGRREPSACLDILKPTV